MNLNVKITLYVFIPIAFALGFLLSKFFIVIPIASFDTKIDIIELSSLFVSIVIAFMIPFFVTKIIEDNRGIKADLIDELKDLLKILNKIKEVVSSSHTNGSFKTADRDSIVFTFEEADQKVNSFQEQISVGFPERSKKTNDKLKVLYFEYHKFLTGGELMPSQFKKVDGRFNRDNNTAHSKVETGIKTIIQEIHKF